MNWVARSKLAIVGLCLLIGGCASGQPTPTPRSVTDVLEGLVLRGATIHQAVSGDAGCASQSLAGNAVRLELTLASEGRRYELYLFRWRRPAQFDEAAPEFARCLAEFEAGVSAADVRVIERPPWRAFGAGWSERLQTTLEEALSAAGGA